MKQLFALLVAALISTGCAKPYQYTVYGRSGATFQAPALCAAVTKCLQSNEQGCYYEAAQDFDCKKAE